MAQRSEQDEDPIGLFGGPGAESEGPGGADESRAGADDADAPGATDDAGDWEGPSREEWEQTQASLRDSQTRERERNETLDRNQTRLLDLLARRTEPAAAAEEPGAMPDPTTDPDNFNSWLHKRDAQRDTRIAAEIRGVETRVNQNQTVEQLFAEFGKMYPGVADKRALVESASIEAGVVPGDSKEKIFRETKAVLERWQIPLEAAAKTEPNRTGGVAGGGPGRRRRAARRSEEDDEPQDFVDQISGEQVRLGLH